MWCPKNIGFLNKGLFVMYLKQLRMWISELFSLFQYMCWHMVKIFTSVVPEWISCIEHREFCRIDIISLICI